MSITLLKKGQMQLIETIGVLFVFFLLLAFGLIFYASVQNDKIGQMAGSKEDLNIVTIVQSIRSMPELKCTDQNSIIDNCYDLAAIESLSQHMRPTDQNYFLSDDSDSRFYFLSFLQDSNISVSIYDEKNKNMTQKNIYYHKDLEKNNRAANYVPITIRDPKNGEYYFGILYITVFT